MQASSPASDRLGRSSQRNGPSIVDRSGTPEMVCSRIELFPHGPSEPLAGKPRCSAGVFGSGGDVSARAQLGNSETKPDFISVKISEILGVANRKIGARRHAAVQRTGCCPWTAFDHSVTCLGIPSEIVP